MNISYDYYRVFYYVAKYKSFTGAAKALLNNQPNITRMMKKLEEELGSKQLLFAFIQMLSAEWECPLCQMWRLLQQTRFYR